MPTEISAPPPKSARAEAGEAENQLVTFFLGEEEFGFDIMSVREIIRQPQLARVPMAPPYVEGICNLRGTVLPIIDTRTRFGMQRAEDTDRTRVLVVDVNGNRTGLKVDRVRQVTRVQRDQVESPPSVVKEGISADFLQGVVKLDGGKRMIMALNPRAICKAALEETAKAASRTAEVAKAGAKATTSGGLSGVEQLVSFRLGNEEFAFRMERVREILRVEKPNEVPDSPPHVLGVLTVRGEILPVIDLRVLLELAPLETEIAGFAAGHREAVAAWTVLFQQAAGDASLPRAGLEPVEAVRQWVLGFNTSSQALMDTLSKLRTVLDRLLKAAHAAEACGAGGGAAKLVEAEVIPESKGVERLLKVFEAQLAEAIREDQRLVVVQARGTLLALLVDKVREVLTVARESVVPSPDVATKGESEICGLAKLDQGKRVIVMLDADRLMHAEALEEIQRLRGTDEGAATTEEGTMSASLKESTKGSHVGDEQQFVTFMLHKGEYGIPIENIQEIDRSSRMTRLPRAAAYVEGVTNLRGEVIPVINARKRFGLPLQQVDERARVIILDVGGKKTGLLVDSVREVLNIPRKDVCPRPRSISNGKDIDRRYISGIGKLDEGRRMVVLLDVAKIVSG